MVNPESDLYRAHPEWTLGAGERVPKLQRNQLVLDLTRQEVWDYLYERFDHLLTAHSIAYVKWDHNRELLEAGSRAHGGAPAVHLQDAAFVRLLDALRIRHPGVAFESCASGGGRIDLNVIQHVQRVWTSDQTDALARQSIQRWTAQLIAPEYLGAHVASPQSHHTGRTLGLDFRAATALFGAFGIEWNLNDACPSELERLAQWVQLYKHWRPILHTGRMVRLDVTDPAVLAHGVIAADQRSALLAHVQMDESVHNRGVTLRVPGLDPKTSYTCTWVLPTAASSVTGSPQLDPAGPTGGTPVIGADLAQRGIWLPRQHPETVRLIAFRATGE
jgi:alpha-galactosidase